MDHWEALPKLRELHRIAGASTKPTGLARLCSSYVAHLMVNPRGRLQLFHHFHHNLDDGLNDRTDEVWALQGGPSMAHAVAIRPGHQLTRQMGFHMDLDENSHVEFYRRYARRCSATAGFARSKEREARTTTTSRWSLRQGSRFIDNDKAQTDSIKRTPETGRTAVVRRCPGR
jgi:hypothetical protein